MSKTIAILTLGIQITLTFIVTFCIYMVYALVDSDFGIEGLFGIFFFQPVIAIILSCLTIATCLIIGLPIRLNSTVNNWWVTNYYISLIGIISGITFLIFAFLPNFRETVRSELNGETILKHIPNSLLSVLGWFLTTFSLLHTYPPKRLTENVKAFFKIHSKSRW